MSEDKRSDKRKKVDKLFDRIINPGPWHGYLAPMVILLALICDEVFGPGEVEIEDE